MRCCLEIFEWLHVVHLYKSNLLISCCTAIFQCRLDCCVLSYGFFATLLQHLSHSCDCLPCEFSYGSFCTAFSRCFSYLFQYCLAFLHYHVLIAHPQELYLSYFVALAYLLSCWTFLRMFWNCSHGINFITVLNVGIALDVVSRLLVPQSLQTSRPGCSLVFYTFYPLFDDLFDCHIHPGHTLPNPIHFTLSHALRS